jgi:predicted nucleotide-binding protein (sugar kinase/HSP70/actin superfamily)
MADDENDFLGIDLYQLDKEWVRQPSLVGELADKAAQVNADIRDQETDFEVLKAKVMQSIRANPGKYGLVKETEAAVKEALTLDDRIIKRQKRINELKYKADIIKGGLNALEHKKRALEKLVDLHGREYFDSPRANIANKEVMEKIEKRALRAKGRRTQ